MPSPQLHRQHRPGSGCMHATGCNSYTAGETVPSARAASYLALADACRLDRRHASPPRIIAHPFACLPPPNLLTACRCWGARSAPLDVIVSVAATSLSGQLTFHPCFLSPSDQAAMLHRSRYPALANKVPSACHRPLTDGCSLPRLPSPGGGPGTHVAHLHRVLAGIGVAAKPATTACACYGATWE